MKNLGYLVLLSLISIVSAAQTNYALSLDGTDDYVSIGSPLSTGSSYTKEAWVYCTSNVGSQNIVSSNGSPFWISSGILSAGNNNSYSVVTAPTAMPLNRWVHVAVTYDVATTTMRLYRDGILLSTNTSAPAFTSEAVAIGSHQGTTSFFLGRIDEVRIWNIARTAAQVKQNVYKTPPSGATGLIAYYKCNNGSGTTLTNTVTGTNGTLQNGAAWIASPVQFAANGVTFDGTDDHIVLPNSISSNFTIEYWMRTSATGGGGVGSQWYSGNGIVDAEVGGVANDWGIALVGTKVGFGLGSPDVTIQSISNVNTGSWVHVAATWLQSTGQMQLYVNGVLEANTTGGTALRNAPPRITVGQIQTNINRYNGSIDELRIWNVVRTQTQIQDNRNRQLDASTEPNLVSYYTFDQGIPSGTNTALTVIPDLKGNNNADMVNFAFTGAASNFTAQNPAIVILPLQWHSFTAQKKQQSVLLNWSTATEQDTRDFTVQHSTDGLVWKDETVIAAAGNSNTIRYYTYTHSRPSNGINYYRISQTDIDGKQSYSAIRSVNFGASVTSFSILNNPVTNGVLKLQTEEPVLLTLFNNEGRQLLQRQVGAGIETIDLSTYAKGVYLLRAKEQTTTFIIQ